jgi:ethanolamine kinase
MISSIRQTISTIADDLVKMIQPARNGERKGAADGVRFVPLSYNSQDSPQSAMRLVLAVRPDWADDPSSIELIRCTDGITNTLLKAVSKREGLSKERIDEEAVLLRAYGNGTDVIIDRQRETENHELLMKYGLAPELLARFENGMLYRYISGRVTTPEDLRQPTTYRAVARRLAEWHAMVPCLPSPSHGVNGNGLRALNGSSNGRVKEMGIVDIDNVAPGKPAPNVWTVMQKWILALPSNTNAQRERQAELQGELHSLIRTLSQRPGLGTNGVSHGCSIPTIYTR